MFCGVAQRHLKQEKRQQQTTELSRRLAGLGLREFWYLCFDAPTGRGEENLA
jgi:hypothetical protein